MQCVNLTDDELWRAIAENTQALSLVVEQRHGGADMPRTSLEQAKSTHLTPLISGHQNRR
jgi:hypothetical protein